MKSNLSFKEFYAQLRSEFKEIGGLSLINPELKSIHWPNTKGVYTIWRKRDIGDELIYVGLAGKIVRKLGNVMYNNSTFKDRSGRWTPYRFCESKKDLKFRHYFRFGPTSNSSREQEKIKYSDEAYMYSIPYDQIEIHCFSIALNHPIYTPALLESLILTKYLKDSGDLPIGNSEA